MSQRGGAGWGFTLVELLVVIAILVVLAAILFPAFAHAREQGRQAACMSNQRQLALAIVAWTQDHNECLPKAEEVWSAVDVPPNLLICPTAGGTENSYAYSGLVAGLPLGRAPEPATAMLTADGRNPAHLFLAEKDFAPRHHGRYIAGYLDGHAALVMPAAAAGAETDLGQTIEGCGSANFNWLQYAGMKYGIAFRAPKTGTVTQITLQWKRSGEYGSGTYGRYTFELQNNGPDDFPSGNAIASAADVDSVAAMDGWSDGALHFDISASLMEGKIYHLVITNTDPTPDVNWSSPNTLMTRVIPWDGAGNRGEAFTDGKWTPWSSRDPAQIFNPGRLNTVNGAHSPTMLTWADGATTGDPYYSAAIDDGAYFYRTEKHGEFIRWDRPATTIHKIGISVGKTGNPGTLTYHLQKIGGGELATGCIATANQIAAMPTWVYAALPAAVTLQTGASYRLWFESPNSSDRGNCFFQYVPYGENRPPEWLEGGWGGTAGYFTYFKDGEWKDWPAADLSFSLQ